MDSFRAKLVINIQVAIECVSPAKGHGVVLEP